jgi:hypothetical protein
VGRCVTGCRAVAGVGSGGRYGRVVPRWASRAFGCTPHALRARTCGPGWRWLQGIRGDQPRPASRRARAISPRTRA